LYLYSRGGGGGPDTGCRREQYSPPCRKAYDAMFVCMNHKVASSHCYGVMDAMEPCAREYAMKRKLAERAVRPRCCLFAAVMTAAAAAAYSHGSDGAACGLWGMALAIGTPVMASVRGNGSRCSVAHC
jgi:hypothetical protein